MVACVALRLGGRSPVPTSSVSCNCSSNPNLPAPSCSYLLAPWANGSSAMQSQQTRSTLNQSGWPLVQRRHELIHESGASTSDSPNWGRRARRNKEYGPLRVTNASQEAEPSVQSNHSNGQSSGNGTANGAVHKQALSRVEWWRIDGRGGFQTSLESVEAGPSQSNADGDSVMGPRGRTVGWIREEHSENGKANEEELWTWQAATQTLHLNGTAMHGRLKSSSAWTEESREEMVVSSQGAGSTFVTHESVSRSVTSGNESSVDASDSSQNGALRSSQNGASGSVSSSNGVSKLAGMENGYAGSVQAENGRIFQEALGGSQSMSASEAAVAGVRLEKKAGSKKKLKKDGKKAKKAAKAALENVKKKGKKKKGKGVALEKSVVEVAQTSETKAGEKPLSSFVDINGVRMYRGPGYVDRMESKFSDMLTSLSEAVKLDKKADKAAAITEKPSQNGAAKTDPPAENLEERLRDLRRKAIEHKARHEGEKGTLMVPTKQPILVLMRHGQSMWNELKLFTGDVDIPLTEKGAMEALSGGHTIKDVDFDIVFTSRLLRAKQTAMLALTQNSSHVVPVLVRGGYYGNGRIGDGNRLRLREAAMYALDKAACKMVPVFAHPALNERCYGDLQGLNKEEAAKEFGKELVQQWRRSNDTSPPGGESLVDTARRARKYYVEVIEPRLREGKNVLVVTHGNVMRGLIAHLANLEEEEMLTLEISTAFPYAYAFSRESDAYAQCCLMKPMEDFITGEPLEDKPMGLASVLKKKNFDSLI